MTHFYLLRHGEVDVDPSKPASEWALSDLGRSEALRLVEKRVFADIDVIYSSEEKKAYCTAARARTPTNCHIARIPGSSCYPPQVA